MELEFTSEAISDLVYWKKINNKVIINRINKLLKDILDHPFEGLGKPELLKSDHKGIWSRRITKEHRILYLVKDKIVYIMSLKGHYNL